MSAYNPRKGPIHGPSKTSGLYTCLSISDMIERSMGLR